ncbi:uncharacterized protein LOC125216413 [Salvia hispanica]|uniref:uncharacterized protein LOC125216413 n=1 Tax=Salvia hispanica TaxID=49212 RepID=UPI002009A120|nr:uncharacterized protein LOC125216413 [Salvia hispanica]
MLQCRRAIFHQANSLIRLNYSSISHKYQGTSTNPSTQEDFTKSYNNRHEVKGTTNNPYEDQTETTAETAKGVVAGALEAGVEIGKMAKKTVDGMVDAAENVRDSLDDDDSGARTEKRSSDKFVEELRRRGDGYDLNDRR